jgi:KUP system potassium uptake protein
VNVLDEPYALQYQVEVLQPNDLYRIEFNLGFREEPRIDYFFRKVVQEMAATGEIDLSKMEERPYSVTAIGDYRFVVTESYLSYDNDLPWLKRFIMKSYYNLRSLSVKDAINFGLDISHLRVEKYPLVVQEVETRPLQRING